MLKRKKKPHSDIAALEAEEAALRMEIDRIREVINKAPEEIQREEEEKLSVMPAPDELIDRQRERSFDEQVLCRKEIRNEHRHQMRSGLLFIMLVAACVSLTWWIWQIYTGA